MLLIKPSRRDFLKGTGILIVSFSLPARLKTAFAQSGTPANTMAKTVALDDVDAFLAIDPSGGVTLYSGKVDLGTGIGTALTQIVAEELDVPLARIQVVEGDTALTRRARPGAVSRFKTAAYRFARLPPPPGKPCCRKRQNGLGCPSKISASSEVRNKARCDRAAAASRSPMAN